jgi:hypothetical protein
MTSHDDKRTRPTRAQRLVAFGFLGAFGLTILTVLLTGLWVRSPSARREEPPPETPRTEQPVASDRAGVEPHLEHPDEQHRTTDAPLSAQGRNGPDSVQEAPEDQAAQGRNADPAAEPAPR